MVTVLISLIVFGLVVLVHEFGHFAVAKLSGITVHEFSIGMGPKIFGKKSGDTSYSLRAIPLGGYVKMEGEDEESESEGSFSSKSIPKRMAVILAGAFMNFVLAFVVFVIYFMIIRTPINTIGEVIDGSPAQNAGIVQNDIITEIDGKKIDDWQGVTKAVSESSNKEIVIKVERNGVEKTIQTEPEIKEGRKIIGIVPATKLSLIDSVKNSVKLLFEMIKMMFEFIGRAIRGGVSTDEVSGPLGVYHAIGTAAKAGLIQIILITGFLSVNLGFFNLLPIPALDGSRFVFLLIEAIRGKKLDPQKEGLVHIIGFTLLIGFTIFITYKDILKFS